MPARTVYTVAAAACLLLAACRPLYVPLVPADGLPEPRPVRLAPGSELGLDASGRPHLTMTVLDLPHAGWVAVQWLDPRGREAASESVWLDPEQEPTTAELSLPADVAAMAGEWRVVVSFEGLLLRQLLITVP